MLKRRYINLTWLIEGVGQQIFVMHIVSIWCAWLAEGNRSRWVISIRRHTEATPGQLKLFKHRLLLCPSINEQILAVLSESPSSTAADQYRKSKGLIGEDEIVNRRKEGRKDVSSSRAPVVSVSISRTVADSLSLAVSSSRNSQQNIISLVNQNYNCTVQTKAGNRL